MNNSVIIQSISQVHQLGGLPKPKHPLVSVIQSKDLKPIIDVKGVKVINQLYQITLKDSECGQLIYGKNSYDYQEGTLIFTKPEQVTIYDGEMTTENETSKGWSLIFHSDLMRNSKLGNVINQYGFFSYDANEALHLSNDERNTLEDILDKIIKEYSQNMDKHTQNLIVSNIELFLDYCTRFYDRQFYTRTNLNCDVVSKFERLLQNYFEIENLQEKGIPSVHYCAEKLHFSPNYLSDLLKKETGKTTQEHIHLLLIEKAKNILLNSNLSISEIAYNLGFEYPQHFSNLFKLKTGLSPKEYRNLN